MTTNLKSLANNVFINEVFKCKSLNCQGKILVMDSFSTHVLSACCKMNEIMRDHVIIVEDIMKTREPLPKLDVIYIIQPVEPSIDQIIDDFKNSNKYRAAHVFFLQSCNDQLFAKLGKSRATCFIKTCKEINISFIPTEKLVYSLGSPETFSILYQNTNKAAEKIACLENIADQIATLCSTLGEYPRVRYRSAFTENIELAKLVQKRLDFYKIDDPNMNNDGEKAKSQLIILDRGFDPVSPLLHELTFQAMIYDIANIENNFYRYDIGSDDEKEVVLDDSHELWVQYKHKHIKDVGEDLSIRRKSYQIEESKMKTENASAKELINILRKHPQHRKEKNELGLNLSLYEKCKDEFNHKVKNLCEIEQNIVTKDDNYEEEMKNIMKGLTDLLPKQDLTIEDKLRLIILYLLDKNGTNDEDIESLLAFAQVPKPLKQSILNLSNLGLQILTTDRKHKNIPTIRIDRKESDVIRYSRWTPYLKDIIERLLQGLLKEDEYPFLQPLQKSTFSIPSNLRSNWSPKPVYEPRIIIYIIGGVTYSEIRSIYELSNSSMYWDILIGSDHILTPKKFIENLSFRK